MKPKLIRGDERYAIVGAAMKVHTVLGPGFSEQIYQEALAIELGRRSIPFEREKLLHIDYDGIRLNKVFYADFVCYEDIIVELKATPEILDIHLHQLYNYLRSQNFSFGLLINFGELQLTYQAVFNSQKALI